MIKMGFGARSIRNGAGTQLPPRGASQPGSRASGGACGYPGGQGAWVPTTAPGAQESRGPWGPRGPISTPVEFACILVQIFERFNVSRAERLKLRWKGSSSSQVHEDCVSLAPLHGCVLSPRQPPEITLAVASRDASSLTYTA